MTVEVVVTGLGIQCAVGADVAAFTAALRAGVSGITYEPPADDLPTSLGVMARIRHTPDEALDGLDVVDDRLRDRLRRPLARSSRAARFSLLAAAEAYARAGLTHCPTAAIVVAGASGSRQLAYDMNRKFQAGPAFVRPSYAHEFWGGDFLGVISETFGILGEGLTTGGASAAGNVGLIEGFRMVRHGYADVCLVVAPMAELSPVELMAMFNLGALAAKTHQEPAAAWSRPFDVRHKGFVRAEGAAALVLESGAHAAARAAPALARFRSGVIGLQGQPGPAPSVEAEVRVMRRALREAEVTPADLDYVNAHATSTPLGDLAEVDALRQVLGEHAGRPWVNSTKSLIGHSLGAASAVEAVACVQQLREGFVHPNANLDEPITDALRFAPPTAVPARLTNALSNSFGFGGISTCVVFDAATNGGAVRS